MNKKIILMTSVLTSLPGYAIANANVPFIDDAIERFNAYPGNKDIDIDYTSGSYTNSDNGNKLSIIDLDVTFTDTKDNSSILLSFDNIKRVGTPISLNHSLWFNGLRVQVNNPATDTLGINDFLNIINENGGIDSTYEASLYPNEYTFKNMINVSGMAQVEINYAIYSIDNNNLTGIDWTRLEDYKEGNKEALNEMFKKFGIDYVEIKIKDNGIVDYVLENIVNKNLPENSIERMNKGDLVTLVKIQSMAKEPEIKQLSQSFAKELIQFIEDNEQIVIKINPPNDNISVYDEFLSNVTPEGPKNDKAFDLSKLNSMIEIR